VSSYPATAQAAAATLDNAVTFSSGLFTNRPAASLAGRVYYATDTTLWFLDTGTTWVWVPTGQPSGGGGSGTGSPPVGAVQPYVGSSDPVDPDGTIRWLVLDGRAVSRSTYSGLFGLCGTTYGSGDGSTTFNIPNPKSRAIVGAGQGSGLSNRALGSTGGAETVAADLQSHSHTITDPTHFHTFGGNSVPVDNLGRTWVGFGVNPFSGSSIIPSIGAFSGAEIVSLGNTASGSTGITGTNSAGSGGGHNNMQPYLALNHIVRAL